jgi:protein involved in polysaccharide export with SLBB domain
MSSSSKSTSLISRLVVVTLLAGGCPGPAGPVVRTADRPPVVDMSLGPSDVFEVRVYGEPELTSTYRVSPEGSIDFPLIGRVVVKGSHPAEIAEEIRGRLSSYVKQPQVSVFVKETNSKKVTVYGQVQHPGTINYVESMTISHAVSVAGGLSPMAARDRVRVTRVQGGRAETFQVNLKDIAEGTATYYLQPGDEVFVPERVF